jgi:PAS domain S-box-containing protein
VDTSESTLAQSEDGLRQSELRYRLLALAMASVVWTTDAKGNIHDPSPTWEAFTGQSFNGYRGPGWLDAVHPDERDRVRKTFKSAFNSAEACLIEHRLRRRDQTWRDVMVRAVPVPDDSGNVREWICACVDVSDRVKAEEDLRTAQRQITRQLELAGGIADSLADSEQRLRLAIDAGRMGTWEWTVGSGNVEWSPTLEKIHGLAPNTFAGTFDAFLSDVHPADRELVANAVRRTLEQRLDHHIEYRLELPDGSTRWVEGRGKLFCDATGKPQRMIGVCMDITQRKWAEQLLLRSKEELERLADERTRELQTAIAALRTSNRALEDFASVASHDLQEPLRKIQAFGGRLEARAAAALDEESQDYLRRMLKAAGRMQKLISDLLEFSRVTTRTQPFVPVDLNVILTDVLGDLETRIEQSHGHVAPSSLPTLDADAVQMQQLLLNLIANALKFHRPDVPPVIDIYNEISEQEGVCRISVRDNGIGFDEKYLDRIFNVFQRLHGRTEYEGTGIGLAVCRKIAERHGGSITARSIPGTGSTFVVTLPLRHPLPESVNVQ